MKPVLNAPSQRAMNTTLKEEDGRLIIANSQDCTSIAEHCKALHNDGQHGSGEMRHAALIPLVIVEKYCNDNGVSFREFMGNPVHIKRMCNDPDNAMFRIWKGDI